MPELLTVVALDSLLIFLLPSLFQEAGPWGEGWRFPSGSFSIGVFAVGCIHPDVLFFLFCLHLSRPGPVRGGIHGIWVTGRLVLQFEGVEEFHFSFLFAPVFEVDPLCMACQGSLLPFCIIVRPVQSQHILVQLRRQAISEDL